MKTTQPVKTDTKKLDLTASRRLALRARESGVLGLLLRQAGPAEPGAALTRWLVSPRPAGTLDDFVDVFTRGAADAALAASIFHYAETSVRALKQHLKHHGIPVRS